MFTTSSTTLLTDTGTILEIKYDFISSEEEIAFSMGDMIIKEMTTEKFVTGKEGEGK